VLGAAGANAILIDLAFVLDEIPADGTGTLKAKRLRRATVSSPLDGTA